MKPKHSVNDILFNEHGEKVKVVRVSKSKGKVKYSVVSAEQINENVLFETKSDLNFKRGIDIIEQNRKYILSDIKYEQKRVASFTNKIKKLKARISAKISTLQKSNSLDEKELVKVSDKILNLCGLILTLEDAFYSANYAGLRIKNFKDQLADFKKEEEELRKEYLILKLSGVSE